MRENRKKNDNARNLAYRLEILIVLGGRCVSCGFCDFRALQVDHVNNDGFLERPRNFPNGPQHNFGAKILLEMIQKDLHDKTGKYQLLCANCNQIKKYEHERLDKDNT